MYSEPILNDPDRPLVSVIIFNYNYGRYLRQCFDSVFAQTYDNIEICFSDNASTDDSWDIALEYVRKYPGMVTITRNRKNFGSDANLANCLLNARGTYFIELCSDDALMPNYVKQCVHALETHPKAAFAIVHRTIIDEHGQSTEEPPFYNQSCIIPGEEQAAVYMMAAVNPSVSQIMYHRRRAKISTGADIAGHWYCSRIMDFNMCCEFPIVYIKEPLLMHRLHLHSHSLRAAENLMEVIGPYVLQHQFAEIASIYNMSKVVDRLPQSLDKLSKLCLRYCVRALIANNEKNALRYFHLAIAISPDVKDDSIFINLQEYWTSDDSGKLKIIESLQSIANLTTRSVSYDPPPGSIPIEVDP
jgi:glycosyltransferase involved in cell wall biosynthesis